MILRMVVGLAVVLGLLLLAAAGLRLWGRRLGLVAPANTEGAKRFALAEAMMLDSRHRLLRVRDGKREHVILLGASAPVVVESRDAEEQS